MNNQPKRDHERPRRLRGAVPRVSAFLIEHFLLLPLGAAIAMVWVNTAPESYYQFTYAAEFPVNDVAMVFFFAVVTKEVVEATAPGGVLHSWRKVLLPVAASIPAAAPIAIGAAGLLRAGRFAREISVTRT